MLWGQLVRIVKGTNGWLRVIVLECIGEVMTDPAMHLTVFETFTESNVYEDIATLLGTSVLASTLLTPTGGCVLSDSTSTVRIPLLDQLDKDEAPVYPQEYALYLSFNILLQMIKAQSHILKNWPTSILITIEMASKTGPQLYKTLSFLMVVGMDEDMVTKCLEGIGMMAMVVGTVGHCAVRDLFVSTLCALSISDRLPACASPQGDKLAFGEATGVITERNLAVADCLVDTITGLLPVMDSNLWIHVLTTLHAVEMGRSVRRGEEEKRSRRKPTARMYESTTSMELRPFTDFVRTLGRFIHTTEKTEERMYLLLRLSDLSALNIARLVGELDVFGIVVTVLTNLAHATSPGIGVRTQAITVLGEIVVNGSRCAEFGGGLESRLLDALRGIMAFEGGETMEGLGFLVDVRRQGLEILNKLLQRSGQDITSGWTSVLDIVFLVVEAEEGGPKTLIKHAFPCLQLIITDFLGSLSPPALLRCIQTAAAITTQSEDLNISLTAVGLLWTLCDYILTGRERLHEEEGGEDGIRGSLLDLSILGKQIYTLAMMDTLWMYLLRKLSELCSDERVEVRESAGQTLFRSIGTNGRRLTLESWELCFTNILFPLMESVSLAVATRALEIDCGTHSRFASQTQPSQPSHSAQPSHISHSAQPSQSQPPQSLHYSQPSQSQLPSFQEDKTFNSLIILTLNGISKTFIEYYPVLIRLPDFEQYWRRFLNFISLMILSRSQLVSTAALKDLKNLICSTSSSGPPSVSASSDALAGNGSSTKSGSHPNRTKRISFEIWTALGLDIVNSSLPLLDQSVLGPSVPLRDEPLPESPNPAPESPEITQPLASMPTESIVFSNGSRPVLLKGYIEGLISRLLIPSEYVSLFVYLFRFKLGLVFTLCC